MTRITALLMVAAVLAGGGAASRASTQASAPVTGDIYVVASAGGTRHALTSTAGEYELQPSVSPDGRRIAYLAHGGIRLMGRTEATNDRLETQLESARCGLQMASAWSIRPGTTATVTRRRRSGASSPMSGR